MGGGDPRNGADRLEGKVAMSLLFIRLPILAAIGVLAGLVITPA